jgi:hypothetical protein
MAVTGPKDIIIVIDTSGSMAKPSGNPRNKATQVAVSQLIKTFSPMDYVGLITFSSRAAIHAVNMPADLPFGDEEDGVMVPMTDGSGDTEDNKGMLQENADWALQTPMGGTNFYEGFKAAFKMLRNSMKLGYSSCMSCSSGCSQIMLFMTDGIDESGQDWLLGDIKQWQTEGIALNIPIFSYSFGAGATLLTGEDAEKAQMPRKIACQNQGIAYDIPDGGSLGDVMSDYYKYFSSGLDPNDPALTEVRWMEYLDASTGIYTLLAGCQPVYNSAALDEDEVELLGVVCMDINMIVDLIDLKYNRDGYPQLLAGMKRASERCNSVSYSEA